jgi:hypothetical protein
MPTLETKGHPMMQTPNPSFWQRLGKAALALLIFLIVATPLGVRAEDGDPSLMQSSFKVRGYIWNDNNCDGIRQQSEGGINHAQTMNLFYIGNDGIAFTRDDNDIGFVNSMIGGTEYASLNGGGGLTYYIGIRPADRPAGFRPSLYQQGADRTIDNDMQLWPNGAWATGTFVIAAQTVTGIDIGLCPVANMVLPYKMHLPLALR